MNTGILPAGTMEDAATPAEGAEWVLPVRGMNRQACTRHVQAALRPLPGVHDVTVDLPSAQARIRLDPSRVTAEMLQQAVEDAGYVPGDPLPGGGLSSTQLEANETPRAVAASFPRKPALFGLAGSLLLLGFYLGLVSLAQGFQHATELLQEDWYFVLPITVAFGVQMGLFLYVRQRSRSRETTRSATATAGAGTGTSTVSMVACCAHHLADLLPLLGLSGAALFLAEYRQPLMLVGIATSLVGIAAMVRTIRRSGKPGDRGLFSAG